MATQPSLPNQTTARKWASLNEYNYNHETGMWLIQVVLTSAQLLALKTTPQIIISSVGAQIGEVIVVRSVSLTLSYNSAAYTLNGGNLKLYYGPVANAWPLTADLSAILTVGATNVLVEPAILLVGPDVPANMCAQNIYLANAGAANYTVGNSQLTVTVEYSKTTP